MDSEYKLPVKTMACYANFRGYDYVRISLDSDRLYFKLCQNRDVSVTTYYYYNL